MTAVRDAGKKTATEVLEHPVAGDPNSLNRNGTDMTVPSIAEISQVFPHNWAQIAAATTGYTARSMEIERDGRRWINRIGLHRYLEITTGVECSLIDQAAGMICDDAPYFEVSTMITTGRKQVEERFTDSFYRLADAERVATKVPEVVAAAQAVAHSPAGTVGSFAFPSWSNDQRVGNDGVVAELTAKRPGRVCATLSETHDFEIEAGRYLLVRQPPVVMLCDGEIDYDPMSVDQARALITGPESAETPMLSALIEVLVAYDWAVNR